MPSWGAVYLGTDVSGVLPASSGGTGLSSPGMAGNLLRSNGAGWVSGQLNASDVPGGSGNYIQNQAGQAQNAQLWISGIAKVGSLQVGGGTSVRRMQIGTLTLNPPGRCNGYPVVKCTYTYPLTFPTQFSTAPTVALNSCRCQGLFRCCCSSGSQTRTRTPGLIRSGN